MGRIDFEPLASQYVTGRALSDEAVEQWRIAVLEQVPLEHRGSSSRVIDVGSGTGEWSGRLASWLDTAVVGVELSAGMLAQAQARIGTQSIRLARARAEALPVRADSADVVWISNVLHHVPDLTAATRDFRRVLRPDGVVLVRGYFTGLFTPDEFAQSVARSGLEGRYLTAGMAFVGVNEVLATFPSIAEVDEAFRRAGFAGAAASFVIVHRIADNLQQFHHRMATRADTTLQLISDDEFEAGLRRLRDEIAAGPVDAVARPIIAPLPFVVYRPEAESVALN